MTAISLLTAYEQQMSFLAQMASHRRANNITGQKMSFSWSIYVLTRVAHAESVIQHAQTY